MSIFSVNQCRGKVSQKQKGRDMKRVHPIVKGPPAYELSQAIFYPRNWPGQPDTVEFELDDERQVRILITAVRIKPHSKKLGLSGSLQNGKGDPVKCRITYDLENRVGMLHLPKGTPLPEPAYVTPKWHTASAP